MIYPSPGGKPKFPLFQADPCVRHKETLETNLTPFLLKLAEDFVVDRYVKSAVLARSIQGSLAPFPVQVPQKP